MYFRDVRHQDRALSILRRALRSGRTHHAYLFEGPEGVGKLMAARALAARLLCHDERSAPDADACGACHACHMFAAETHPDYHFVHRGLSRQHPDPQIRRSKGLFLVVDLVRHFIIEPAGMKPTQGRRRVFVIDGAERMNEAAQNALLKTLEEPPGDTCLILVSASAAQLLPTIRSRCQRVPFNLLPSGYVADVLVSTCGVPSPDARMLAELAQGRLGTAVRWRRIELLGALDVAGELVASLRDADPEAFGKGLVQLATELGRRTSDSVETSDPRPRESDDDDDGEGEGAKTVPTDVLRDALKVGFLLVATYCREALLALAGASALRNPRVCPEVVDALVAARGPAGLQDCVFAVLEAERMLDRNVPPQLVCERLAVALLGETPVLGA